MREPKCERLNASGMKVSGFSMGNPYVINEPQRNAKQQNANKITNGYKSSGYNTYVRKYQCSTTLFHFG